MGLFGGSKSKSTSTSTTTNETNTYSQSLGDLSRNNIMSGGDATIYGLYGEDMQAFLSSVTDTTNKVLDTTNSVTDKLESLAKMATTTSANLAGNSIAEVAKSYQSAYSETTGMLQQIKPVLFVGVLALSAMYGLKLFKVK